jgi:hypothetical protein
MNREDVKKLVREESPGGVVRVELGERSYDVSIGEHTPGQIAD